MSMKTFAIKQFAKKITRSTEKDASNALILQTKWFNQILSKARNTKFGIDHHFKNITNHQEFSEVVPIRDYEALRPYIDLVVQGQPDILWPGIPKYFAKTSGTTSGVKYIPISHDSISNHFNTARDALFNFLTHANDFTSFSGKMIFFGGSPQLDNKNGILTGRLSGIVNHEVPSWLQANRLPSYKTNCIEDWENKLDAIITETLNQNLSLIGGIPPWVQMFYERLLDKTGKKSVSEIFPTYSVYVHGGVNYSPYQSTLHELVGKKIWEVETYPASEGFFAYQNHPDDSGLLLNINSGIFFEFIPAEEIFNEHPTRVSLKDVEPGINYAIIINNNAGLYGYNIGDTVEFTSIAPYKIRVTGRVKHFISAFGEHVISKEVDDAMREVCRKTNTKIIEFSVAPMVNTSDGSPPYHEWFVEFEQNPDNLNEFAAEIDALMCQQNIYYKDLIVGRILQPLKINVLKKGAFQEYMKSIGKLGAQNKVPRLKNDRSMAEVLMDYVIHE